MIDLLIYHLHVMGVLYAFTKRWQEEGLKGGALAIGICLLVFVILWGITGTVARLIMPDPAKPGDWFTSDTLSLVLLLVPEIVFFWVFFLRPQKPANPEPAK